VGPTADLDPLELGKKNTLHLPGIEPQIRRFIGATTLVCV
jgi:hypothetical protein